MVRFGAPVLAGSLAVLALTPVIRAQAGAVKGTLTVGTTTIVLAHGMAVSYASSNGSLVSVLLSDKPADREEFATDTTTSPGEPLVPGTFEGAWKSQHFGKRFSGLTFTLADTTSVFTEELLVGGRNNTFSLGSDEYVIEVTSTSPRLVGHIRTRAPIVDTATAKAGVDATFDLPVEAVAPR